MGWDELWRYGVCGGGAMMIANNRSGASVQCLQTESSQLWVPRFELMLHTFKYIYCSMPSPPRIALSCMMRPTSETLTTNVIPVSGDFSQKFNFDAGRLKETCQGFSVRFDIKAGSLRCLILWMFSPQLFRKTISVIYCITQTATSCY